jgi:flagellar biosynthesis protein FlhF
MKIRRFIAADIRQAMRMVKEELGADAVILSNRTVEGGIEIVAARDFDEQLIQNKLREQTAERQPAPQSNKLKAVKESDYSSEKKRSDILGNSEKNGPEGLLSERPVRGAVDQYVGYAEKMQLRSPSPESQVTAKRAEPVIPVLPVEKAKAAEKIKTTEENHYSLSDKLLMEMCNELKSLRMTFDRKVMEPSQAQGAQVDSARASLLQRLTDMSISQKTSVPIVNQLNSHANIEMAFAKAQEMLADMLPMAEDEILEIGGIAALVGPTGVGKTTTIAKLAAQFILKHGANQVALITTDNYRIGAFEQLNTYGRILGVPVRAASTNDELRNLINSLLDKRLILIDTAGMSQRDMKLVEQINTLRQIKSYLVVSSATEYKLMNEIIQAFRIFEPQAAILTKLDEAVTIGSALSSLIEHRLPLSFMANGQRVPEDIFVPDALSLVDYCMTESKSKIGYDHSEKYEMRMAQGYA